MITAQMGQLIEALQEGAWGTGIDALDCESLLLATGLFETSAATQADLDKHEGLELEIGDAICRLTPFAQSCVDVYLTQREERARGKR